MSVKEFDKVINEIYEANYSHLDFIDNMGGECECAVHTVVNFLHDFKRSMGER